MRRRADERGAVAVFTALIMVIVLVVSAFAVDLGMQRVLRRDVQALADIVAIDLSRLIDGRTASQIGAGNATHRPLSDAMLASVARNDDDVLGDSSRLQVVPYLVVLDDTGGYPTTSAGLPTAIGASEIPEAVVVVAKSTVDFGFANVIGISEGSASRTAVASNEKTACFELGSYAAAVNTNNAALLAPLNGLLGLNLSLLSYQGLAGADLSIEDLAAAGLAGGTPDGVLNSTVTLGEFYQASLAALQAEGDDAGAAGELDVQEENELAAIALQQLIDAGVNLNQPVQVADIINVDPTDAAGLTTDFNVLDIITGGALLADGDNAVSIPALNVGTATTGTIVGSTIKVIERARRACGTVSKAPSMADCQNSALATPDGCARNAQLTGSATIPLAIPALNGFGVTTNGAMLNLNLGNAAARLIAAEPTCRAGTLADPDTINVELGTSLATSSLTTALSLRRVLTVTVVPAVPPLVPATTVSVVVEIGTSISATLPTPASVVPKALQVPPNDETPLSGGSRAALAAPTVSTTTTTTVRIDNNGDGIGDIALSAASGAVQLAVNLVVNPLVSTTVSQVSSVLLPNVFVPLVDSVNGMVIGPLAELLGLDVAGADVYASDRPTCQTPKLVG